MLLFWSQSGKLTGSLFSFPLNGRDSSLLFRLDLPYFSPLVGQIILSPTPFLLSLSRKKVFWVQFLLSLLFGQKHSKSNFIFTKKLSDDSKFCLSRKIIPTSQRYSKSQSLSDLEKLAFYAFPFYTLAAGVQTVSTNASFGFSVCGFRWRVPVLKHEWILNCRTLTRSVGK